MCLVNHEYTSSVERHMLTCQKVGGSMLSWVVLRFCRHVQIHTSFYTEITRENTISKHERYTTYVANRNLSLTRV